MQTTVFSVMRAPLTTRRRRRKHGRLHWLSSRCTSLEDPQARRLLPNPNPIIAGRASSRYRALQAGPIRYLYVSTGGGYLQFDYAAARSLDAHKTLCYIENLTQPVRKHT